MRQARAPVGDHSTLSLLGRNLDARIAGLRRVELGCFGASFALVVDPAALAAATASMGAARIVSRRPEKGRRKFVRSPAMIVRAQR